MASPQACSASRRVPTAFSQQHEADAEPHGNAYPRFFASQWTQSLAVLGLSSVFVSLYTIEKLLALSRKGVLEVAHFATASIAA